jgi:predicted lysophospholipase L1 biosynthesis ABC-type transport system permease subunit
VVNEAFVRTYFPGEDALGRRLRFSPNLPAFTIVGIAEDTKVRGAREAPRVETFAPYWQFTERGMNVILESAGNPAQLAGPLRQAIASIDPSVPVSPVTILSELVADSIEQPRFFATLAAAFAILALALAAIGLYGVMAYAVSQRTAEIGVRMALGASPSEVFRLVIGDGLRVTAIGIAFGTIGSFIVARWLTTLLFGVRPGDPTVFLSTAALLLLVATAACLIPARRATRVDPMIALRTE